jgi:hypothetical protein
MAGGAGPFGVLQAAGGQTATGTGASGGPGGYLANAAGATSAQLLNGGGGGGGGGVGYIRIHALEVQPGMVSPSPDR